MNDARRTVLLVAAVLVTGSAVAVAQVEPAQGPCWCEVTNGGQDAGSLPQSAHTTDGRGPMFCIDGETRQQSDDGVDLEDMYLIRVCEPSMFLATTAPPGAADFNTMLWLFEGPGPGVGRGRLGNDNDPVTMSPRSRLLPVPDDGEPPLTEPGLYYLAISGFRDEPVNAQAARQFLLKTPTEISGADGPGGGDDPISGWMAMGEPAGGTYRIWLRGVTYATGQSPGDCNENGQVDACDIATGKSEDVNENGIPDECECVGDVDESGVVDFGDILKLLAVWGACAGCPEDVNGDGVVDFGDVLLILSNWGPCS